MSRTLQRVMVIEDDLATAIVHSFMLKTRGYTVTLAESGEQALERIEHVHPDAIVLDLLLPGIDGFDVARELARRDSTSRIPILLVTGQQRLFEERARFRPQNIRRLLHKPCDREDLVSSLDAVLGNSPPSGESNHG